jgi:LPXTG-site transpeptidase (sortase) family protein
LVKLTTVVVIIGIIIVGMYALLEVSYLSSKISIEKDISSPVVIIPSIGLNERINNVSLSQGIMIDEISRLPTQGEVILHGHRTSYGSPFFRLNEVNPGDKITVKWPGIGQVNYTVKNTTIVPPTHTIPVSNETQRIFLITCDPPGFSWNRMIITADMDDVSPLNDEIIPENPNMNFALFVCLLFLGVGSVLSYFYPIKEDKLFILAAVLIMSGILIFAYFVPIDPDIPGSIIGILNGEITF